MRFYINILTTYFPDIDPSYDVYYRQVLEQVELAEELGWECFMFNEHHFLGYGGLVVASNWTTADNATLLPIERWTYQAGDIIDKHGYFGGPHKGDGAGYSVRVGLAYEDRIGLVNVSKLPVHMIH